MTKLLGIGIVISSIWSSVALAANSEAKHSSRLIEHKVQVSFDEKKEIPSPLFLFTGTLVTGVNKAVLTRRNGERSGSFSIDTAEWQAISLLLRLDYHNIGYGENHYKLSLWKGNQLSAIRFFDIDCFYEEKVFDTATLYINEKGGYDSPHNSNAWTLAYVQPANMAGWWLPDSGIQKSDVIDEVNNRWISEITGDIYVYANTTTPYLVKYGESYHALESRFVYNNEKEMMYEYRNLQLESGENEGLGTRLEYGDLYINGILIATAIPLIYHDTGAGNGLSIDYTPSAKQLRLIWRDGDGGGYFYAQRTYTLPEMKEILSVDMYSHWGEENGNGRVLLITPGKKLEIFSPYEEGTERERPISLKYRYSTQQNGERKTIVEDFIVNNAKQVIDPDATFLPPDFYYSFDPKTNLLKIERDRSVGGKAEVYVRNTKTFPIFYRSQK